MNKHKFIIQLTLVWTLLSLFQTAITAQPLSLYTNLQKEVMVWDDGSIKKIDFLPPVSYKIGRTKIPYMDNARNFKIYTNGGVQKINIGFTTGFEVSDHLLLYSNGSNLYVYDNGESKRLATVSDQYYLGDSVVFFKDGLRNLYNIYYNGEIINAEDFLAADAVNSAKVSDNMIAYKNYANQLYQFYQGQLQRIEDYEVEDFAVGRNTLAYIDANYMLRISHKGQINTVENFPPKRFSVGDDLVAYVSNEGYLKVFYDGMIYDLGYLNADVQVADNIVYFVDNTGYFKAFYKGKVYSLETQSPTEIMAGYHTLVWRSRGNILKMLSYGTVYEVTTADVDDMFLNYDVLTYRIGVNLYRFFYKGKTY